MHPVAPALVFTTLAAGVVALFAPALLAAAWRRRTQVPHAGAGAARTGRAA
ncbi:hypothetical protein [Burkholderia pyrrocinia]|uniref:hypothetical protein n=1 Tax=Burkholderia pyrrocinia TaxID=60550 RepID=UPI00191C40A5|nr:hypothetical protein [Burkholderia pyrrocinia]